MTLGIPWSFKKKERYSYCTRISVMIMINYQNWELLNQSTFGISQ